MQERRDTGVKTRKDGITVHLRLAYWVCYVFMFVICCLLYQFLKSHILITTILLMILMPMVSMGAAWWMRRYLSLSIRPMWHQLREGQEGIWRIRLRNDSYGLSLACTLFGTVDNVFLGTTGALQVEMPISMKYTETMDLPLGVQYPGLVRVQITHIEYKDPMGLLRIRMPLTAAGECVVLPQSQQEVPDHREGYQAGITEAEETLTKGNDFSEVTEMREYRPGDRLKDIHWKLSAKKQDLMVKERASVAQSQVILLLDLSGEQDMVSQVLELAYGITKGFLREYVPVRLLWWDEQKYDFGEVLIAEAGAQDDGFGQLMHGHVCRTEQNLPSLIQRVRPALHSYVYLHPMQGMADGEVISHA